MTNQGSETKSTLIKYGYRLLLAIIIAITLGVIVNMFIPDPPEGLTEQQFLQLSAEVQQNAAAVAQDAMVVDERTEALEEARLAEIEEKEGEIARLEEELRKAQEDLATSQANLAASQKALEEAGEATNATPSPISNILDDNSNTSTGDDGNSNTNTNEDTGDDGNMTVVETADGYTYEFSYDGKDYSVTVEEPGIMVLGIFDREIGGSGPEYYVGGQCEGGLLDAYSEAKTTGFTYNENNEQYFEGGHVLKNDDDLTDLTDWVVNEVDDFEGLIITFLVEDNIQEEALEALSEVQQLSNSIIIPFNACPDWTTMELPEN